jgi:hypothetical protein
MFVEDSQDVSPLNFTENLGILNFFASRIKGKWTNMNYGSNSGTPYGRMVYGESKNLLIATGPIVNNSPNAILPTIPANYISRWTGKNFESILGGANGSVYGVAISPENWLYVTGAFTSIGGVAANRVAYYNGVWNAMGAGINNTGYAIEAASDGTIYVGGNFTQAGGINASKVAKWVGGAWYPMGSLQGLDNTVFTIKAKKDSSVVYIGGAFAWETGSIGTALSRVAAYDPLTNLFSSVFSAGGFDNNVLQLVLSEDGILYACGDFTVSGTTPMNHIARYDGSQWASIGSGVSVAASSIFGMSVSKNGNILVGGRFQQIGGINARSLALWNGSVWTPFDIDISSGGPNIPELWNIFIGENEDIYIGGQLYMNTNSSNASAINVVNNTGSAEVSPKIFVTGPGRLRWIENQTTGKRVYLDLPIISGDKIDIDFETATITSVIQGNMSYTVLPGSDFKSFTLVPGNNTLAIFMSNDVNGFMSIRYIPSYWSADAIARTEVY